ncbi:EF-hand domain-containing protein [Kitasatospora sp. NPDC001664]
MRQEQIATPSGEPHEAAFRPARGPARRAEYAAFVLFPLVAAAVAVLVLLDFHGGAAQEGQRIALCAAAAFFNVFVLLYHLTHPPHPKFLMLRRRRLAIRTHAVGGVVELVAGVTAYFVADPTVPAVVMALAGLVLHVPTAAYQITVVFGAKAVMVPGYVFVVVLHAFCAVHLLAEPRSTFWLVNTFLVLNIYVWCRVFIGLFNFLGLFQESAYSVAIMFSGLLMIPAVVGFAGNLLLVVFVFAHVLLYRAVMKPSPAEFAEYVSEKGRETLIDQRVRQAWASIAADEAQADDGDGAERRRARALFDALGTDRSGSLTLDEIDALTSRWPGPFLAAFVERYGAAGEVSFEVFYRHLYRAHGMDGGSGDRRAKPDLSSERAARRVFDRLDLDGSGSVDAFELRLLLLGWGLPDGEVDRYLRLYDDGDGCVSFEEFHTGMRPIWQFGAHILAKEARNRPTAVEGQGSRLTPIE